MSIIYTSGVFAGINANVWVTCQCWDVPKNDMVGTVKTVLYTKVSFTVFEAYKLLQVL